MRGGGGSSEWDIIGFVLHPYQVEDWMQERVQQLRAWSPLGNLKDYLKHLQKHQVFKAEVQAHEQVMTSVAKVTLASTQTKVLMAKVSGKKVLNTPLFLSPSKAKSSSDSATLGLERSPRS